MELMPGVKKHPDGYLVIQPEALSVPPRPIIFNEHERCRWCNKTVREHSRPFESSPACPHGFYPVPPVHDQSPDIHLALMVVSELRRAQQLHAPMANAHEALAVIEEEVHEFKLEVYKKQSTRDLANMKKELIQGAAMHIRAIIDCKL